MGFLSDFRKVVDRTMTLNGWDKKNDRYWKYKQYGRAKKQEGQGAENNKAIIKALELMDGTNNWWKDENEATRELITCLKTMGYLDAEYQFKLEGGRTADGYFNNSIIEGKLNPSPSDLDRLIGQLEVYCEYDCFVHVVVYGQVSDETLARLHYIVRRNPEQIFLAYLDNPSRNRLKYFEN